MTGIKRFCLIIFALLGVFCVCVLMTPWLNVPPVNVKVLLYLTTVPWFFYAVEIAATVALIGFFCIFVMACAKKKPRDLVIKDEAGAHVTVTRQAIASQATYLAESVAPVQIDRVHVQAKYPDALGITLAVQPLQPLQVREVSQRIERQVRAGLGSMLGVEPAQVNLRFVEAHVSGDVAADPEQEITVGIETRTDSHE